MSLINPDDRPPKPAAETYYETLWLSDRWGGQEPNFDEQIRLNSIETLIKKYVYKGVPLSRILDVGCGRGWLTQKLSKYGTTTGLEIYIEPMKIARKLFPQLNFSVVDICNLTFEQLEVFGGADLIVCSEVLEHVSDHEKRQFFIGLNRLMRDGGHLLITTPRGELWQTWSALAREVQPIEDWITESDLVALGQSTGFRLVYKTRVYLRGAEYHAKTAFLLRSRVFHRLLGLSKTVKTAIVSANSLYQVMLFQRNEI